MAWIEMERVLVDDKPVMRFSLPDDTLDLNPDEFRSGRDMKRRVLQWANGRGRFRE